MKYKVYSGLLDWTVTVEASSEPEAIEKGRELMLQRLREDTDIYAREYMAVIRPDQP